MPHGEPHIEEPQVVDYSKVFNTYYSDGLDMKTARRMLRAEYGKDGRTQFEALSEFYKKKGALAPVGNRVYYGLKRSFITSEIKDKTTNFRNSGSGQVLGHAPLVENRKYALTFLTIGLSNNQVFFDKLILNTGIRFSFPLNKVAYLDLLDTTYEQHPDFESDPNQAIFEIETGAR